MSVSEVSEKVSNLSMAPPLPPSFNPAPRTEESSQDQVEVTPAPIGEAIPVLGQVNIHNLNLILDNTHFENDPYRSIERIH